jgi:ribosomal protein L37AE/L43A
MSSFPVFGVRVGPDLTGRGYHVVYREEEVNHCPGCGRTHWIIGRISAECAFCATALPLADVSTRNVHATPVIRHRNQSVAAWAA